MQLGELGEVGAVLEIDHALHHDIHRVPAERREAARGIGRHDRLDARGELGGLLPVEHGIEAHAPLGKGGVELDKGLGSAGVLAGAQDVALESFGVLGVDDDDHIAAVHRLRSEHRQGHAFARLGGADDDRSALEVHQRSLQRVLARLDAVDVRQPDFGIGLRVDGVAEQAQQPGGYAEIPEVNLGEFVETLRVHRMPLETEPEKHLLGLLTVSVETSVRSSFPWRVRRGRRARRGWKAPASSDRPPWPGLRLRGEPGTRSA